MHTGWCQTHRGKFIAEGRRFGANVGLLDMTRILAHMRLR